MINPFLVSLFKRLKNDGLKYIVLRNYEHLPQNSGGSDLDIFINKVDKNAFIEILNQVSSKLNGCYVSIIKTNTPRYCLMGFSDTNWGIMIDLHFDEIAYRGQTILSNNTMWNNIEFYNDICVLNKKSDALVGIFKELLNNKSCKEKYYNDFLKFSMDYDFLYKTFNSIGRKHLAKTLYSFKETNYSRKQILTVLKVLEKDFPSPKFSLLKKLSKIHRAFNQPGYSIAFLGTDGSGKSTIIDAVSPILNEAFHNSVYYEHLRPNKLPSIAKLLGKKEAFEGPVTDPHSKEPSGFFGSLLRWSYYLMDYTIGYGVKVFPKKAFKSCVWIFDRYYYDYLIDKKRTRVNLPNWVLRFGQFIIPEPDLIICLGADPVAIHSRKPELPLIEVQRQVKALSEFCRTNKRAVWIDTGQSIDSSVNDTMTAITKIMAKRFKVPKNNN